MPFPVIRPARCRAARWLAATVTGAALAVAQPANALVFSLTGPSATGFGFTGADLLTVGPGPSPVVAISGMNLGLLPGDELNALSFGPFVGTDAYFSVDASSTGQSGTAVDTQATLGHQAGDVFVDPFPLNLAGLPSLAFGQGALGLGTTDDIDALDMDPVSVADTDGDGAPDIPIYFSLAPGSPTLGAIGATAADILMTMGGVLPSVAVPGMTIGLMSGDDIDALLYSPSLLSPVLVLSLAPGSPTLTMPPMTLPMSFPGWSPADVFAPNALPMPGFAGPTPFPARISTLGLVANDNVDAFSDMPSVTTAMPEPETLLVFGLGLVAIRFARRRRAA